MARNPTEGNSLRRAPRIASLTHSSTFPRLQNSRGVIFRDLLPGSFGVETPPGSPGFTEAEGRDWALGFGKARATAGTTSKAIGQE